jgi:hypothetical protein
MLTYMFFINIIVIYRPVSMKQLGEEKVPVELDSWRPAQVEQKIFRVNEHSTDVSGKRTFNKYFRGYR